MESKENKIKAVRLSDDELENVSGACHTLDGTACCYECRETFDIVFELYLINKRLYCAACKELLGL